MRRTTRIATAALLAALLAPAPGALAQGGESLSDEEFNATLADMQEAVDDAAALYAEGDQEAALERARFVAEQFSFSESGASPLERKIKAVSATAIGDRVKAYATKLVSAIEAGESAEDVQAVADELSPSLNRLVLVAQGKTTPASQRELRTPEAIDAAVGEVLAQVREAARLHGEGDLAGGKAMAEEAFFTFEVNGLGADTEVVDKRLEDEAENLIVNFDQSTVESDPGLSQLIDAGANATEVAAQVARIEAALGEVSDLLKATLPPMTLGDANADGKVSIVDALLVAQAALGILEDAPEMDANQDGRVTIVDALHVAQAALGIRNL